MDQKRKWIFILLGTLLAWQPAMATDIEVVVETICTLPQPDNNGQVVGHDVGFSNATAYQGYHYFFFGDTIVKPNGFRAGTFIARSNDTDPDDCIDLDYKTGPSGKATQLIPQNPSEDFVWPAGSVVANGSLYTYYEAYELMDDDELNYHGSGLAKIETGPEMNDTSANRIGDYFFTDHFVSHPLLANEMTLCGDAQFVYLFVVSKTSEDVWDGERQVLLVRVDTSKIEEASRYLYYRLSDGMESWVTDFNGATPIHTVQGFASSFQVHFDTDLNRYRATYSCGFGASGMCTATANTLGKNGNALRSGWSTGMNVYDCPGKDWTRCYQTFTQTQYGTGATKYMTAAHNWQGTYHIALRKVAFGGPYSFETGPTGFTPVDTCRLVDTRERRDPDAEEYLPNLLADGGKQKLAVAGKCGVPAFAKAVALNVVALEPAGTGRLQVYPRDAVRPESAPAIELDPSMSARANNMIIKLALDGSGEIQIYNDSDGEIYDYIVDVSGYFE